MHRHCGTNNRAPRWTFTYPCKQKVSGRRQNSTRETRFDMIDDFECVYETYLAVVEMC